MRGFFTVIFFIVIFFAFPIAVFIYSINSVFTADYIKNRLNEAKIYSVVAEELPEFINKGDGEEDELILEEAQQELKSFVTEEISAKYIQGKIEPFIDDSFSWLNGEEEKPPQVSLADLGEKLKSFPISHLLSDEINDLFAEPLKFDEASANQFKSNYQVFKVVPIVMSIISVIALLLIILLAKGWKSKLRRTSWAIFLPAVSGLIFAGIVVAVGKVAPAVITGAFSEPGLEVFVEPINSAFEPMSADITRPMFLIYGISVGLAILFFVISFFVSRKKEPKVESVPENSKVKTAT